MRKAFVFVIAVGMSAFIAASAVAKTIKLGGTHTSDEIKTTCKKNGGAFYDGAGSSHSNYGCVGRKGTVECDKNGNCTGTCDKCGGKSASSGKGGVGGVLTGSPKTQPLRPQQTTTSPGRAPMQATRSPKNAPVQPLTAQKMTSSTKTAPTPMTTSSSSQRRNR